MYSRVKVIAPAKINLTLDVVGKRDDGYHFMEMIMQSVSLYDIVTIERTETSEIEITSNNADVPCDDSNIVYRIAKAFLKLTFKEGMGLKIHIDKSIPMQAGLAGGSADGAATLIGLDRLFETHLQIGELCELGSEIGADIPFCIVGGTMLAEGIGDIFTPLSDLPACHIVIAKPRAGISTRDCFERLDRLGTNRVPDTEKMVAAIICADLEEMGLHMINVLEDVAEIPEIEQYKQIMCSYQAKGAMMTGSGSAVIGVFESKFRAKNCCRKLREIADAVFLVQPVNKGAEICELE